MTKKTEMTGQADGFRRWISAERAARLAERGIRKPTPIQEQVIPLLLEGKDVIAGAQTGTGKTLAYLLPLLEKAAADENGKALRALVLAPTRELAVQIGSELEWLAAETGIRSAVLIGGASLSRQVEKLKKTHPHIVIGTPGRVLELVKLRKLKLHQARSVILDEADEILALGAAEEVGQILLNAPRDRQTVLFSATVSDELAHAAAHWLVDPIRIVLSSEGRIPDTITHTSVICEERDKIEMLKKLIRAYDPRQAIIFASETDKLEEVRAKLAYAGFDIAMLYGDTGKQDRAQVMKRFREGKLRLLLSTDVAARGLDVPGVTHVFHFDPAPDADRYVHRTGRTGRMGRKGTSVSMFTPRESFIAGKFSKALGISFQPIAVYSGKIVPASEAPQAKSKPGPRKTAGAAKPEPTRTPGAAKAKAKQAARETSRKNKGAPRWLKEKSAARPKPKA